MYKLAIRQFVAGCQLKFSVQEVFMTKNPTQEAVERQVSAMSAVLFEVGLFKPADPAGPAKEPEMLPRTWDIRTLLKSVGWLKYQNSIGRNIYIRPKGEHSLSLVDDLTAANIERMKKEGVEPCLIVETSPGNFQAWVNHGEVLPRAESTAAARTLAERFGGDKGAADWRHYGRLAGFTNRKEKYRQPDGLFPFVRLIDAAPRRVYTEAPALLAALRADLDKRHQERQRSVPTPQHRPSGALLTIEDFRAKPEYSGDGNRVDLAYALYALSHGVSETAVRTAIASRDLSKKGNEVRRADYIDRTIRKALATLTPARDRNTIAQINAGRNR
jgi:hypothetical protein